MENTLSSKYLWMVVDGTEPHPESPVMTEGTPFTEAKCTQVQEVQDWIAKDKAASGIICNGCNISQWPHIQSCRKMFGMHFKGFITIIRWILTFTTTLGSCLLTNTSRVL